MLRDGLTVCPRLGKSINHLHLHLVPDCDISPENNKDEKREFYEDGKFDKVIAQMKKKFL